MLKLQFAAQADQKLLGDVTEFLIENTKFDLPAEFLKKWLQTVGEKKLSPEEAEVEYARSEKGLRFQLIEGKALAQSNIQITFEDLKIIYFKKYPSANGTIRANQSYPTKKFKELWPEFWQTKKK